MCISGIVLKIKKNKKYKNPQITVFNGMNVRDSAVFTINKNVNATYVHALTLSVCKPFNCYPITILSLLTYPKSLTYKNMTVYNLFCFLNSLFFLRFYILYRHITRSTHVLPMYFFVILITPCLTHFKESRYNIVRVEIVR